MTLPRICAGLVLIAAGCGGTDSGDSADPTPNAASTSVAAASAVPAPQVADARLPVLLEVGRIDGNQPTARWSLPEGAEAFEVCFEPVGAGSTQCWGNFEEGTRFAPLTERLGKGTYNVYVLGSPCAGCPLERSNSLKLVIPAP